jgi:hypothetical protein
MPIPLHSSEKMQGYEVDEEASVASSSVIPVNISFDTFRHPLRKPPGVGYWGACVPGVVELFLTDGMANAVLSILLSQVGWAREAYVHSVWFTHLRRIANHRSALGLRPGCRTAWGNPT